MRILCEPSFKSHKLLKCVQVLNSKGYGGEWCHILFCSILATYKSKYWCGKHIFKPIDPSRVSVRRAYINMRAPMFQYHNSIITLLLYTNNDKIYTPSLCINAPSICNMIMENIRFISNSSINTILVLVSRTLYNTYLNIIDV